MNVCIYIYIYESLCIYIYTLSCDTFIPHVYLMLILDQPHLGLLLFLLCNNSSTNPFTPGESLLPPRPMGNSLFFFGPAIRGC